MLILLTILQITLILLSKPQQYRETPRPFNMNHVKHVNLIRTGGLLASNPSLAGRETNLAPAVTVVI